MSAAVRTVFGLLLLLAGGPAHAQISGPTRVIDGDTLEVGGQHVRLWGIMAPEIGDICGPGAERFDCGAIARTQLMDLTAGLQVICEPVAGPSSGSDPVVAMCTAGGFSLNRNMVYTGWALADRAVSDRYVAVEDDASAARRGLWRWRPGDGG